MRKVIGTIASVSLVAVAGLAWVSLQHVGSAALSFMPIEVPVTAAQASTDSCANVATLGGANVSVHADVVAPGAFTPPMPARGAGGAGAGRGRGPQTNPYVDLPAFCRITATLTPTSDSDIRAEIWLPMAEWNGNFRGTADNGWAGYINYAEMATALRLGYATSGTDGGHQDNIGSGAWGLGHPEKVIDFADRAVHLETVLAKRVITEFYHRGPRLSTLNACGGSNRMALKEAQVFPADYDVFSIGGFANYWTHHPFWQIWVWQASHRTPRSIIPAPKLAVLHEAALAACDANDGVTDRVIQDPPRCKFDPAVVACAGAADGPNCLTPDQVTTAKAFYSMAVDPDTKKPIYGPFPPGSELGWGQQMMDAPFTVGLDFFRYFVYNDPNWDPRSLDFTNDRALRDALRRADAPANQRINAMDGNLSAFARRGGKMLLYGGWSDAPISGFLPVEYYQRVLASMGDNARTRESVRLFMVPDMGECVGSNGYRFDPFALAMDWKATGQAPKSIQVSHVENGMTDRTMLVCPYPEQAVYSGNGDTKDAANFKCMAGKAPGK